MDWVKLFELFVNSLIQLIQYTAWPLTILVLVLIFRKAILRRLGQLKKITIGDKLALEFSPFELQKKMAEKVKFEDVAEDSLAWDNYLDVVELWMGRAALFSVEMIQKRMEGSAAKNEQEYLKDAMREYDGAAKKIEKERPESEALKIMCGLIDCAIGELKSYESTIPKPHWSDDL